MSDIADIKKTRDQVCRQLARYFEGEVTAEDTARIGYAGIAVAALSAIKFKIERAE